MTSKARPAAPLQHLDDWEEVLKRRYPPDQEPGGAALSPSEASKKKEAFRDYASGLRPGVRDFYRLNHRYQTLEFVLAKKREYLPPRKRAMGIWQAMEFLTTGEGHPTPGDGYTGADNGYGHEWDVKPGWQRDIQRKRFRYHHTGWSRGH